jgi:hypothetical protein
VHVRAATGAMPLPLTSFDGLPSSQSPQPLAGAAADTSGAAGHTDYVEMINRGLGIFDKQTGALVCIPMSSNAPWPAPRAAGAAT